MSASLEQFYAGGFVVREAPGMESRAAAVLSNPSTTSPLIAPSGLVLSLSPPAAAAAATLGTNQGNGTVGPITTGPTAIPGTYVVNVLTPTTFIVEDPTGAEIGNSIIGSTFSAGGLSFTITAGATAFVPGDAFTIAVHLPTAVSSPTPARNGRLPSCSTGRPFLRAASSASPESSRPRR